MSILQVFKNGQLHSEHLLDESSSFTIGRDKSNTLCLADEKTLSRKHLLISFDHPNWIATSVSKNADLFFNNQPLKRITLTSGDKFSISGGYDFIFNETVTQSQSSIDNTGLTPIELPPLIPSLIMYNSSGEIENQFNLSGTSWTVGRDDSASIKVNHSKLSRNHFEIIKRGPEFLIRDLNSANGTFLNGSSITPDQWVTLKSGDDISIYDLKFRFILKDVTFESRAQLAEIQAYESPSQNQPWEAPESIDLGDIKSNQSYGGSGSGSGSADINLNQVNLDLNLSAKKKKTKIFRLVLISVIFLLGLFYLFLQDDSNSNIEQNQGKPLSPFEKLTPEQQETVKQLYQAANNFLQQGKYEIAKQELIKLHQIIPFYEDSKIMEETANQGLRMLQEKERLDAELKQKEALEEKIKLQIAECEKIINPNLELYQMESCLAPIIEFDPEHPDIVRLKNQALELTELRERKLAEKKDYQDKVNRLKKLFKSAQEKEKQLGWLKAIPFYELVFKSPLPDPNGLKIKAKNRATELAEMILQKQSEKEQLADQARAAGDLKSAIKHLRQAIAINPDNQILIGKHAEIMIELKALMQPIYQESILEESVGEVETAKSKWRTILAQSISGEDYYEKAKIKLKRYGYNK